MKAKAPVKIYINLNIENRTWLIGKGDTSFIEYVRTDAFIEKACEWIKENLLKHTYVYEGEVGIGMAVFLEEFKQARKEINIRLY